MPRVHFIGIGGVGMNGLAQLALHRHYQVTGSDRGYDPTQAPYLQLKQNGTTFFPQDGSGISPQTDIVVYSTAIEADNPDLLAAKQHGVTVLHRAEFLQHLIPADAVVIAIAGTAGKTTTTGLIGYLFEQAGLNPTVYNGAAVLNWKKQQQLGNVRNGRDDLWIIEADESDRSLLHFHPTHTLLTNIGADHYPIEELRHIFHQFQQQTQDHFIDASTIEPNLPIPEHQLIGEHNQTNIRNACCFCQKLGLSSEAIEDGIRTFRGIERRLEKIGAFHSITVYDDYAHNPMKISAAMQALTSPETALHTIWRPHGFKPLADQFEALCQHFISYYQRNAGTITLLPVFYAGGTVKPTHTSADVVEALRAEHIPAFLVEQYDHLKPHILQHASAGDTLLGMGARDPKLPLFLRSLITDASP